MPIKVERTSIRSEAKDHHFYKAITSSGANNSLDVPFDSMLDAFTTFACLGYHHDNYAELEKPQELTLSSYLDQDLDLYVLGALAYARLRIEKPESPIEEIAALLTTTKTIIPIVEGWAKGGLLVYREATENGQVHPTLKLYQMLEEAQAEIASRVAQQASIPL